MRTKRAMVYAALTAAAWLVPAGAAIAGKPGGGGGGGGAVDTGTIYFSGSTTNQYWRINPDGSSATPLPVYGLFGGRSNLARPAPSFDLHGGRRWFLLLSTTAQEGISAVRDDGAVVQLVTVPSGTRVYQPHWAPGDTRIAWHQRHFVGTDLVNDGFFVADLAWDAAGGLLGLASQPTSPAIGPSPNAASTLDFDWSPDGTHLVMADHRTAAGHMTLRIGDVATGATSILATSTEAEYPAWSPDGQTIAFTSYDGIRTIGTDGTGESLILPNRPDFAAGFVRWSPNGINLVFDAYHRIDKKTYEWTGIARTTATGASLSWLTNGPDRATWSSPSWR